MAPAHQHPNQLDLLGWKPPAAVSRFAEHEVRAVTIEARIARSVSAAMKDSDLSREEIGERMSAYLGEAVSKHMLDAYASQAREEHVISLPRFLALIHATGDQRLLQTLAEMFGWAVVPQKYLTLIDLASIRAREDELKQQRSMIERNARRDGVL
jgi:hypothetical protein